MERFFVTLDRVIFRLAVAFLAFVVLVVVGLNNDWSPLGILGLVWGLGLTLAVLFGVSFIIERAFHWLFR